MKKLDKRILPGISMILLLPALICSIVLGYVPVVALWLMYAAAIPFLYIMIFWWGNWFVRYIAFLVKKLINLFKK